ncbi:hypothetical protein [Rouxiella aceris]|uniref:hypothetical protein n=1 Tax=Rouxiella aceris TaxID=2703884 RepID=UPI001F308CE6|nr:hypothetical protein [Rouxiella aceris]
MSQFNREYACIFGLLPLKDIAYLRKVINVRDNLWRRQRVRKVAIDSKPPTASIAII